MAQALTSSESCVIRSKTSFSGRQERMVCHSRSAILARIRKTGLAQGAVEFLADKIHQLRLLADFLRDEPVKLQTAFVDEIVLHTEKD